MKEKFKTIINKVKRFNDALFESGTSKIFKPTRFTNIVLALAIMVQINKPESKIFIYTIFGLAVLELIFIIGYALSILKSKKTLNCNKEEKTEESSTSDNNIQ